MKMYIIRHGQTPWNARKCLQGRSDVDLNENGIYLAELTGKALRDVTFDMAFTSPLIRAKHTAQCILAGRKVPIIEDERLIEISFGIYEGCCYAEENRQVPQQWIENFFHAPQDYVAAPVSGGITRQILLSRLLSAARNLTMKGGLILAMVRAI